MKSCFYSIVCVFRSNWQFLPLWKSSAKGALVWSSQVFIFKQQTQVFQGLQMKLRVRHCYSADLKTWVVSMPLPQRDLKNCLPLILSLYTSTESRRWKALCWDFTTMKCLNETNKWCSLTPCFLLKICAACHFEKKWKPPLTWNKTVSGKQVRQSKFYVSRLMFFFLCSCFFHLYLDTSIIGGGGVSFWLLHSHSDQIFPNLPRFLSLRFKRSSYFHHSMASFLSCFLSLWPFNLTTPTNTLGLCPPSSPASHSFCQARDRHYT